MQFSVETCNLLLETVRQACMLDSVVFSCKQLADFQRRVGFERPAPICHHEILRLGPGALTFNVFILSSHISVLPPNDGKHTT